MLGAMSNVMDTKWDILRDAEVESNTLSVMRMQVDTFTKKLRDYVHNSPTMKRVDVKTTNLAVMITKVDFNDKVSPTPWQFQVDESDGNSLSIPRSTFDNMKGMRKY